MLANQPCPPGYEEMVYDVWMGLQEVCFCQEGSALDSVYGKGACRGKAANSPYCRTREAINPIIRSKVNGQKFCGRRAGPNFLKVERPKKSPNGQWSCPAGTEPCGDPEAFSRGLQENVICTRNQATCPITSIDLTADESAGTLTLTTSKTPNSLPLLSFKFSTDTPCIDYSKDPIMTQGTFKDEYTSSAQGCVQDSFL